LGEYAFYDERKNADGSEKPHPLNDPRFLGASILLSGSNFGCGSSREHAPQSLVRWGIRAIIAESYAEIFAGNCVMLGTPAVVASKEHTAALQKIVSEAPKTPVTVDLEKMEVRAGGLSFPVTMPETRRNALMEGTWDSTSLLLANADKIRQTAAGLHYMAWGSGSGV
jgi:3-isopropylmalate/(R)-2-methylmalate dehydratase small subunit